MARFAFKMKLFAGYEEEYRRRHAEIWPELAELLHAHGISNYSIFLDPATLDLLGVMDVTDPSALRHLSSHPVMQRWWAWMKDIMESHPDHSPVSLPLQEVFYLP